MGMAVVAQLGVGVVSGVEVVGEASGLGLLMGLVVEGEVGFCG